MYVCSLQTLLHNPLLLQLLRSISHLISLQKLDNLFVHRTAVFFYKIMLVIFIKECLTVLMSPVSTTQWKCESMTNLPIGIDSPVQHYLFIYLFTTKVCVTSHKSELCPH